MIGCHTIHKIKINDNLLNQKPRIVPHDNGNSGKGNLRSNCNMCASLGILLICSATAVHKWRIVRTNVKSSFLQTSPGNRDMYVKPRSESMKRNALWILLAAPYGLINFKGKWQHQSDDVFFCSPGWNRRGWFLNCALSTRMV